MEPRGALEPTSFAREAPERELGRSPPVRARPGKRKQGKELRQRLGALGAPWAKRKGKRMDRVHRGPRLETVDHPRETTVTQAHQPEPDF
jgi:hypothetical protein